MSAPLLTAPTRKAGKAAVLGGLFLLLALHLPSGLADELDPAEPSYAIDNFFVWDKTTLEVLIVPPAHGPLVGPGGQPLPDGPQGALPTGTYLEATLQAIENWRHAIDDHTRHVPWFSQIEIQERVLAVDEVTPQDVKEADILVVYPEHGATVLGVSAHVGAVSDHGPECVAASTLWRNAGSMNRYDMFKLASHEFGHCLGLGHTAGNHPPEDIMSQGGYPNNEYRCPSTLDLQGLVQSFSAAAGQGSGGGQARVPISQYEQICLPETG